MATIGQILAQIRTAIFGRDVRESIAEGIEKCYTDVQSASSTIDGAVTNANAASQTANAASQTANAAAAKIDGMTVAASSLPIGSNPTATISENATTHNKHIAFGIPRGETGVHYGTDEPTDPGVNVWIDPSGDGDSYASESEFQKLATRTAPSSDQLTSTIGETNTDLYTFRKTGGGANVGDREQLKKIIGGTVAWNQLIKKSILQPTTTISGVTFTNNGDGSITVSGTATETIYYTVRSALSYLVRKYILRGCPSGGSKETYSLRMRGQGIDYYDMGNGCVWTSAGNQYKGVCIAIQSGTVISTPITFKPNLIDISQVFGVEIANAIFAMEQSVSGVGNSVGTAWFKKLFPKDYYAEDTGSIQSVQALSHVMRGKNLFDENEYLNLTTQYEFIVNNYRIKSIKLQPFTKYTVSIRGVADSGIVILMNNKKAINSMPYFDLRHGVDQITYTTNETGELYIGCSSSNADTAYNARLLACKVQIEVGDTKTDYVPYESPHTYPFGNVELRGVPKIDGNSNLYYDGDTYEADGTVTRKYGIVDLGTLTWTYTSTNAYFYADVSGIKQASASGIAPNMICAKYSITTSANSEGWSSKDDKTIGMRVQSEKVCVKDSAYTDVSTFTTAMSGVYLVYELATPTTESTIPFSETQVCDPNGTEEFVDTRDVAIPVGHETFYPQNMREKLETIPSIIAPEEHANTTTKDYNIGELFIYQNTLYKATEAIENGGEIKTGTGANCTPTTLAEELALAAGTSATGVSY